jgi:hypothetical protein
MTKNGIWIKELWFPYIGKLTDLSEPRDCYISIDLNGNDLIKVNQVLYKLVGDWNYTDKTCSKVRLSSSADIQQIESLLNLKK